MKLVLFHMNVSEILSMLVLFPLVQFFKSDFRFPDPTLDWEKFLTYF